MYLFCDRLSQYVNELASPNWAEIGAILISLLAVAISGFVAYRQIKIAEKQASIAEKQAEISDQQNKIALFQQRYDVYMKLLLLNSVVKHCMQLRKPTDSKEAKAMFFEINNVIISTFNYKDVDCMTMDISQLTMKIVYLFGPLNNDSIKCIDHIISIVQDISKMNQLNDSEIEGSIISLKEKVQKAINDRESFEKLLKTLEPKLRCSDVTL